VIFLGWLMPSPPTWVSESKSLPILEKLGDDLVAALPPDLEKLLTDFIKRGGDDDVEPGTGPAEEGTDQLENDSPLETPAGGTGV
jgi:membrane protein required for colicin V production